MKRFWNYLKEGKGRGLKVSLIFTFVLALLVGGLLFYTASKAPVLLASTPFTPLTFALLAVLTSFITLNLFYFLQVFFTWIFAKISFLKWTKGGIFRVSTATYIFMWGLIIVFSLIRSVWPMQPFVLPLILTGTYMVALSNIFILPSLLLLLPVSTPQGVNLYPIPLQNLSNLIYATLIGLIVLICLQDKKEKKEAKVPTKKEAKKKA